MYSPPHNPKLHLPQIGSAYQTSPLRLAPPRPSPAPERYILPRKAGNFAFPNLFFRLPPSCLNFPPSPLLTGHPPLQLPYFSRTNCSKTTSSCHRSGKLSNPLDRYFSKRLQTGSCAFSPSTERFLVAFLFRSIFSIYLTPTWASRAFRPSNLFIFANLLVRPSLELFP